MKRRVIAGQCAVSAEERKGSEPYKTTEKSRVTSSAMFHLRLSPPLHTHSCPPPPQPTYILMVLDLIWSEGHLTVFTGFITSRGGHLFCIITAVTYSLCQRVGVSKHRDRGRRFQNIQLGGRFKNIQL
jgi:hypothetical protein